MAFTGVIGAENSSTTGNASLTFASAPADGDLVVVLVHVNTDSDTIADNTGSGATFTLEYQDVDTPETNTYTLFWKVAASEPSGPATYNFTNTSSRWGAIGMFATPDSGTPAVDAKLNGYDSTVGATDVITGITVADDTIAMAFSMRDRQTGATPSVDNSYDGVNAGEPWDALNGQRTLGCYRLFTTGAATGTVTITPGGTNDTAGWVHISFKHAAGGGATSKLVVLNRNRGM